MMWLTIDLDAVVRVVGTILNLDLDPEYLPGRSVRLLMMIQEYFYFLSICYFKETC